MRSHRHGIQRGRAAALATPIALAAGALAMTLCAGAATAQSRASAQRDSATKPDYSAPAGAPYTAENVSVPTPRGYALAGTLTLPRGASRSHPVPAIVTISGTGPQDRD